jgi:hypothetical protein
MAGGIDWFRWHHGSVTDPKFQLVAKKAGASVAEVIAVWACLLEAASQAAERGNPGPSDFEAMDCALGLEDGKSKAIYDRMTDRGLLGSDGTVTAWEKRQPKREDDTAAERKRRQRERDKQDGRDSPTESRDVTQGHDRGEESRGEKKDSVPKGTGGEPPDPIFGEGLAYLVSCNVPEKGARSFLGKMRKELRDDLVAVELLVKAQQEEVSEPIPWLRAAAKRRIADGRTATGVAL